MATCPPRGGDRDRAGDPVQGCGCSAGVRGGVAVSVAMAGADGDWLSPPLPLLLLGLLLLGLLLRGPPRDMGALRRGGLTLAGSSRPPSKDSYAPPTS
eukprot:2647576-Pyramimonas_sp.AAC.1